MFELIEYWKNKIIKEEVNQLTWNKKDTIINLFRYERYILAKALYMELNKPEAYMFIYKNEEKNELHI